MNLKLRIVRSGVEFNTSFEGVLYVERSFGRKSVADELTFTDHNETEAIPYKSILRFQEEDIQSLMDDLWGSGVRPSNIKTPEETLSATQKHLQDMRTLVFDHYLKGSKDA